MNQEAGQLNFLIATLFSALLFLSPQLSAQTLSGTVFNHQGDAIEGATIYSHALHIGTITDYSGKFQLTELPLGKIVFQVTFVGYKTQQVTVTLPTSDIEIVLAIDILNLEEAVVETQATSSQDKCMLKIATMKVEQLDRSSSPSRIQALASIPGVEMISMGSGVLKPVIRGLSGLRVATLFRGARIENQAWGEEHGLYLPEQGIDRIEIIRGPGALVFGADAIGGVLNFLPENPLPEIGRESNLTLRGFSATSGLNASFQTKKRIRNAHHAFSGGYNSQGDYSIPDGSLVPNSHYRQFFAQGLWGYLLDWGKIEGVYSSSYNTTGLVGGEGWQQSGDHIITTSAIFMKYGWKIHPAISYQLNHRKEFDIENVDGAEEVTVEVPELDLELRTLRYDFQASQTFGEFDFLLGSQGLAQTNTNSLDSTASLYISDANIGELSSFSVSTWERDNLKLQAGLRYDYRKLSGTGNFNDSPWDRSFSNLSYSTGLTWSATENSALRANFSTGNRSPGLSELIANGVHHGAFRYEVGDLDLQVERSHNLDISYHVNNRHMTLDVAGFRNQIDNYINLAPTSEFQEGFQVYKYTATDAILTGAELGVSISPPTVPNFQLISSISYVKGMSVDEALPRIPPLKLHSELGWNKEALGRLTDVYANVVIDLVSAAKEVALEETPSPSYQLVNLTAGASITPRLSLSLGINNLLNTYYIPHLSLVKGLGIAEAGRNVSVRLSVKF